MAPTYYVIELSARWLTVLLVALALVMVLAFAFGYGAAWSVLTSKQQLAGATAAGTPDPAAVFDEDILDEEVVEVPTERPTEPPVATPKPTATPKPAPTKVPSTDTTDGFWVQVLASSTPQAMERAAKKLADLGFPEEHQRVTTSQVAGGNVLYKLRVGPFPDRDSADRVVRRMRSSGYPDAWIVVP